MSDTKTGHCLCGAVRFRTRGELREVVACHCSQCRRQTGHFLASTNVANDRLEVEGEESLRWYRASDFARRGFCSNCGSILFWKADSQDHTSILAGAFDEPTGLKLEFHIYCADKGDYYEITDGLPQFAQESPSIVTATSPTG
jgi:hypothetical protein